MGGDAVLLPCSGQLRNDGCLSLFEMRRLSTTLFCPKSMSRKEFRSVAWKISSTVKHQCVEGLWANKIPAIRRCCFESGVAETSTQSVFSFNEDIAENLPEIVAGSPAVTGSSLLLPGVICNPKPGKDAMEEVENVRIQQQDAVGWIGTRDYEIPSMLEQMRNILFFAGPALGIWLSGPLMSIIDTSVIGNSSSLELAALGPGTVLCDQLSYVFMFLSIATSNLIATSLARKNSDEARRHLSRLLFVALVCGGAMLLLTEIFVTPLLQAFVGAQNTALIPAARIYVQIRALAWPAILVGNVAQSASLGMQDSWAPLKVLAVASAINLSGDIFLCSFLKYGIGGAAWATMASQYVGGMLMLAALRHKGFNPFYVSAPSLRDLVHMIKLAGPILLTMISKVSFYTVMTYLATSLGAVTLAAHQVMMGIFSLCTVWGEPLAQTAQSFMPKLIHGSERNLKQARALLSSLMLIGVIVGFTLGCISVAVPWVFPNVFTSDPAIILQMRSLSLPFFCSLMITPPTLSLEGTLLAGRDLKFLGFSMASCFCMGCFLLLSLNRLGFGLQGSWWTLAAFQLSRFSVSLRRLSSSKSIIADEAENVNGSKFH